MSNAQLLKQKAIKLRKAGYSIRDIEKKLKISRSTLSGWSQSIELTQSQKLILDQKWKDALVRARNGAAAAHRAAKLIRIAQINKQAKAFIDNSKLDRNNLEIFLVGLYLGEGFKSGVRTGLGSSSPQILRAFVTLLRKLYNIDEAKLRAAIYARADQDPDVLKNFWSELLQIPPAQFHKTQIDKRTIRSKTYSNYMGVCAVVYFDGSIQRRLIAIASEILGRIV